MKILYLPIFDPSHHAVAVANKRGLYDALVRAGHEVKEVDYCQLPEGALPHYIYRISTEFEFDLILSQFQGTNHMKAEWIEKVRKLIPNVSWVNFNQDYWPEHHTAPDMLELLRHVDLQLVSNGSVLSDYAANGVNAAYWPFGYEVPNRPLPDVPHHDIVFLANAYSEHRRKLGKLLKSLPYNVGLYGSGWEDADGDCNYDFTYGEALYKNAKIAISDNEFADAVGYLSNRPFQILAADHAILLQQHVERLEEFTGFISGLHYWEWRTFADLLKLIDASIDYVNKSKRMTGESRNHEFLREHHSYDVRVRELMAMVEGLRIK